MLTPADTDSRVDGDREHAPSSGDPQTLAATPPQATPPDGPASARAGWRRPVAIVLLATLVGAALSMAGSAASGPSYASESQVLWDPGATQFLGLTPADDPNSMERALADQRDVVTSDPVITAAADALGLDPEELRSALSVGVVTGSSVLTITGTADDAATAFAMTDAVTERYRIYVLEAGKEGLRTQADVLEPTIGRLRADIDGLNARLGELNARLEALSVNSAAYQAAQIQAGQVGAQLADASTRLADVTGQQESLRAGAEVYPGQAIVLRQPEEPTAPASLSLPTAAVLGAALGFVLGVCLVILLRRRPFTARPVKSGRAAA